MKEKTKLVEEQAKEIEELKKGFEGERRSGPRERSPLSRGSRT